MRKMKKEINNFMVFDKLFGTGFEKYFIFIHRSFPPITEARTI